jgi:hypothetical protein
MEVSCQYNEASGFGRSGIPRLYVLRYHKPRSPDEIRLWSRATVTWTRAQPGGLKRMANREIANPVDINIMSS